MHSNFFKIAFRNIARNKGFSAINISGLAIGMAAAMLILLWIRDELTYDAFHRNKDRIYQVWNKVSIDGNIETGNSVSAPLAAALQKDIPEVERAVRVDENSGVLFAVGDKRIKQSGYIVDTGFLQVFNFPLVKGDPATALNGRNSLVITESFAKALFGDQDPMGRMVRIKNEENFIVSGIAQNPPSNSRFSFEFLLPWWNKKYAPGQDLGWHDNSIDTYVLLKEHTSFATASAKIKDLKQKYHEEAKTMKWELFLYPMARWQLYSSFTNGEEDNGGRSSFVKLFGIIAGFILLIACINFMNLSTARSEKRSREVGIRKVIGAGRTGLVLQFIGESVLIASIAGILALVIAEMVMPAYNQLTGKNLSIAYGSTFTWLSFSVFILITGLLAGSYPAFFLSSFKPIRVLKGAAAKANALVTPRKALVVLQFAFATTLIICTIIVKQQIDHAQSRDSGYDKKNLVYHFMTGDIERNYQLIKHDLLASGVASSVTQTNSPLTERWSDGWGQTWEGKDPNDKTSFARFLADEGLQKTAGLQFVQGRDFDLKQFPTDSTGLIINESALKLMKFNNPIGKVVGDLGIDWHIVGVVKDFILSSPYRPISPLLIVGAKSTFMRFQVVHIKLNEQNRTAVNLEKTEAIFKKYNPEFPFEYQFVDESYARKFAQEKQQGILAVVFAALTIFISCLGLFGLAACMAENRIKEIGVRKVLGASVAGITTLLSKDFVKLVLAGFLLATPVSYWCMNMWLENYEYRVEIRWWVFVIACLLCLFIAILTVSYQSIRAALSNPVKSLRSE